MTWRLLKLIQNNITRKIVWFVNFNLKLIIYFFFINPIIIYKGTFILDKQIIKVIWIEFQSNKLNGLHLIIHVEIDTNHTYTFIFLNINRVTSYLWYFIVHPICPIVTIILLIIEPEYRSIWKNLIYFCMKEL